MAPPLPLLVVVPCRSPQIEKKTKSRARERERKGRAEEEHGGKLKLKPEPNQNLPTPAPPPQKNMASAAAAAAGPLSPPEVRDLVRSVVTGSVSSSSGGGGGGGPAGDHHHHHHQQQQQQQQIHVHFPALTEVGTPAFVRRYCVDLERLAWQAHAEAAEAVGSYGGKLEGGGKSDDDVDDDEDAIPVGGGIGPGTGRGGVLDALTSVGARGVGETVVEALLEEEGAVMSLTAALLCLELWRTRVLFPPVAEEEEGGGEGGRGRGRGRGGGGGKGGRGANKGGGSGGMDDDDDDDDDEEGGRQRGLAPLLAANGCDLRAAFVLHAESTLASLLGLVLYRREAAEFSLPGDAAISLVDYCARQMAVLAAPETSSPAVWRQRHPPDPRSVLGRPPLGQIRDAALDATYRAGLAAVSLARYLAEHAPVLPLSVRSRMLEGHDLALLAARLVEEPPWTRRRIRGGSGGGSGAGEGTAPPAANANANANAASPPPSPTAVWEKHMGGTWTEIAPSDLLRVTRLEAQPWLLLFHLLTDPDCRGGYGLTSYRRARLLRLRKYLPGVGGSLLDQIPVLADVARYLDELALMEVPDGPGPAPGHGAAAAGGLVLEQVDAVREALIATAGAEIGGGGGGRARSFDWAAIARRNFDVAFAGRTDASDGDLRLISALYDGGAGVVGGDSGEGGGGMGPLPPASLTPPGPPTLEEVVLAIGTSDASGVLRPSGDGAIVGTPHGRFRRTRCGIGRVGGGDDGDGDGIAALPVPAGAGARARAYFRGLSGAPVLLECADLALPNPGGGARPRLEWRQLGRLEDMLVVQLGFKLLAREAGEGGGEGGESARDGPLWVLSQAFVAQPAAAVAAN